MVYRVFVEKRPGLDLEAKGLLNEARNLLGIESLQDVRLFNRYDAEGLSEELFRETLRIIAVEQADILQAFAAEQISGLIQ